MAVCAACGTENRDKAKFCRGCAGALNLTTDVPADGVKAVDKAAPAEVKPAKAAPVQVCEACQTSNPLAATKCKSCGVSFVHYQPAVVAKTAAPGARSGLFVVLGLLVAVSAAGAWWWGSAYTSVARPPVVVAPQQAVPAVVDTTAMANATNTLVASTPTAAQPAPARAKEAERQAQKRLEREARLERQKAAKAERERTAQAQEQRRLEAARQRTEQLERQAAEAKAAEKAAKAPVQAAPPVQTVEQLCAGSSNVFSRDFCRIGECRKPAFASDPICVSYRAMEKTNRGQLAN